MPTGDRLALPWRRQADGAAAPLERERTPVERDRVRRFRNRSGDRADGPPVLHRPGDPPELRRLLAAYGARRHDPTPESVQVIREAHAAAAIAHEGQVRISGEPYINHPVGVAIILADLGLDDTTLAGALLHD